VGKKVLRRALVSYSLAIKMRRTPGILDLSLRVWRTNEPLAELSLSHIRNLEIAEFDVSSGAVPRCSMSALGRNGLESSNRTLLSSARVFQR
jgi:hypothetical protein